MPGKLTNRFSVMLGEKRAREQRNIPLSEVGQALGIRWATIQAWANNTVTRYDAKIIMALCDYFGCEVGDLIAYTRTAPRDRSR